MAAEPHDLHPLTGTRSAYYLSMREPLSSLPRWRQWLIRFVYFKCNWASNYATHDMGIFTDRGVAEEIAARKRAETGKAWSVKELPVNGLLPEAPVKYGFYSFPGTAADYQYRNRVNRFVPVQAKDLSGLERIEARLGELQERIEGKCVRT